MSAKRAGAELVCHPKVVSVIRSTLRGCGLRKEQDLEDGIAEVQTRALEHLRDKPVPTEIAEWQALCVKIARHWRIDERRKRKTDQKYCEGLCETPDEHTPCEQVEERRAWEDARRMVGALAEEFDAGHMPEQADEILDCLQAGMGNLETAKALGLTVDAVRMRARRVRKVLERRLPKAEREGT